jgi:hypothetical protein
MEEANPNQRPAISPISNSLSRLPAGPRRVSVAAHERWRESLRGGPAFDPDDELIEMIERPWARRKAKEVSRVLAILDELESGEGEA